MTRPSAFRARSAALALVAALVAPLAVAAPTGAQAVPQADPVRYVDPVFNGVTVTRDLVFGAAPDFGGKGTQVLRLDLYEPTGDTATRRPAVVLAFGGGFIAGTRASMSGWANAWARRGYVVASIDYRLDEDAGFMRDPFNASGRARIAAAQHDMQAAVRWLRANAVTYRLDPGKVAVGGYSAGAITAATVALSPDDPGGSGTPGLSSAVCTAVVMAGGADWTKADPGDAGAIFFHGDADPVVPYGWATVTEQAMRGVGLPTQLVTYPGGDHGIGTPYGADMQQRAAAWMKQHVVDRPTSCAGPVDPAAASFVTAAHHDFLGRSPTETELAEGVNWIESGGTRSAVLADLTTSDAWLGAIVTRFYIDTLGREPDAEGLAYWVGALRARRWTVAQVAAQFYAAPEYYAGRGGGTDESWVTDLYAAILHRDPDPDGLAYWTEQVGLRGRTWVATRLYGSLESRRDRVEALYQQLLGRAAEPDGLAYWAARVATDGDLALARSLAASGEYRDRAVSRFPIG